MVVTISPIITGSKLRLAKSKGFTLQMAAAAITLQGINVPPPVKMAAICPKAVKVAVPDPIETENSFASEPTKEMPENPEPSSPVIIPTSVMVNAPTAALMDTFCATANPKSFTSPWESAGNTLPNMLANPLSPK